MHRVLMNLNLIITGVGGQGNVLASQILGYTALARSLKVTIGETFGLSQRGGPVMSHIRFSTQKNYAPLIPPNRAHIIMGFEPLEAYRLCAEYANEETIFIVNARPIYPLNVIAGEAEYPDLERIRTVLSALGGELYWLNATEKAVEFGGPIMLNMVMLGALSALPLVPFDTDDIRKVLPEFFPAAKLPPNYAALDAGRTLIQEINRR
jgi:indolepyruvate ferredoxin oxidoreductase, beta subunit